MTCSPLLRSAALSGQQYFKKIPRLRNSKHSELLAQPASQEILLQWALLWRRLWGNLLFYSALPLPCKQRQIVSFFLSREAVNIKNKSESPAETSFYFLFFFPPPQTGASCEPRQTCEAWFLTSKNTYSKYQWTASNPNFCYWSQSICTGLQLDSIIEFYYRVRD